MYSYSDGYMWLFKEIDFLTGDLRIILSSPSFLRVEVPMKINISALEELRFPCLDDVYIPPPSQITGLSCHPSYTPATHWTSRHSCACNSDHLVPSSSIIPWDKLLEDQVMYHRTSRLV